MPAGCPQKDGRLLGTDYADQVTPGTEPWGMVPAPKEKMQMKSRKGDINIRSSNVQSPSAKPHSLVTERKVRVYDAARTVPRESEDSLGSRIVGTLLGKAGNRMEGPFLA